MRAALIISLAVVLGGCPAQAPEGTLVFPVAQNREIEVEWNAPMADQALWLDIQLDQGRGLSGPVSVFADGREVASGRFSSRQRGVDGKSRHLVHNWSSAPWGVSGQVHLWDLPEVPVGTPMRAVLDLRANPEADVQRVDLQVRAQTLL